MSNNPLKNYFRKAVLSVKLPSLGVGYKEGTIEISDSGELPIYPMTALDEINARMPENVTNGEAVINLIRSCVPGIKDPWEILSTDLDTILLGIRVATGGKNLTIESFCTSCEKMNSFVVDIHEILKGIGRGNFDSPMELNELKIKFKPLTYKQIIVANESQVKIQDKIQLLNGDITEEERIRLSAEIVKDLNSISFSLIGEAVEYIKTPESTVFEKEFIFEFLTNCDKETFDKIKDFTTNLRSENEIKPFKFKCVHCGTDYDHTLNVNIGTV